MSERQKPICILRSDQGKITRFRRFRPVDAVPEITEEEIQIIKSINKITKKEEDNTNRLPKD